VKIRYSDCFLHKNREFETVFQDGMRFYEGGLMLWALLHSDSPPRLGFVVSKKRGKAHERNTFRRRVRAWFLRTLPRFKTGGWFILLPTQAVNEFSSSDLSRILYRLFQKAGALSPE